MSGVAFTLDLEDHRPSPEAELRFPAIVDSLLDDLDEWRSTGTFFVVGEVARDHPGLVARVAARGHEIALHGARHVPLPDVGETAFRTETIEATDMVSQIVQQPVNGFRAPIFSLVEASAWAPAVLADIGFIWSSSLLPGRNPLYGWNGAPRTPFVWPSGLIELPCPLFGIGPVVLPLLGGTYLRVSPGLLTRWVHRAGTRRPGAWLYVHPYDFDPAEERWLVPEVGRVGSRILWWGRSTMSARVRKLVSGSDITMSEMAASLTGLATFDPKETTG